MTNKANPKQKIQQLAFFNAKDFSDARLSASQVKLLQYIKKEGWCLVTILSEYFNCSIQSMSTRLKSLYDRGYLVRVTKSHATGGDINLYYIAKHLRGDK